MKRVKLHSKLKKVYGVGINDSDDVVFRNTVVSGVNCTIRCQFYDVWRSMLGRCYSPSVQKRQPSYKGCSVCCDWLIFSNFKKWMQLQDYNGKQLDKDLLVLGNKVYSPQTCVFICQRLNKFMTESTSARGYLPIGVTESSCGKFQARCNNPFTAERVYLGVFLTPELAHIAYKECKYRFSKDLSSLEINPNIIQALEERYG